MSHLMLHLSKKRLSHQTSKSCNYDATGKFRFEFRFCYFYLVQISALLVSYLDISILSLKRLEFHAEQSNSQLRTQVHSNQRNRKYLKILMTGKIQET